MASPLDWDLALTAAGVDHGTLPYTLAIGADRLPKDAARLLARYGFPVFPLRSRGKKPLPGSHGFDDATIDESLPGWSNPRYNVGVATGEVSGLVVLDMDPDEGGDDSLHELERQHGELARTLSVKTPRGGQHFYFDHPEGVEVRCHAPIAGHAGLDLRANGGYVVVPPSTTGQGAYTVDELAPLAPMPGWLLELTAEPDRGTEPVDPDQVVARFVAGLRTARDPALTQLTGMLLRRFVPIDITRLIVHAVNRTYCQPPKPAEVVEKIVDSIAAREGRARGWW